MSKSETIKKPKRIKLVRKFFQFSNFNGVYRRIFSYIPMNREVFEFSLVCKNLYNCFTEMLERSSTRYYRLLRLNGDDPSDHSIDLFQKSSHINFAFKKGKFVNSIDEYENGAIKDVPFFKILSDINKKHGEVCMISGGYAMMKLYSHAKFEVNDIDVFILGRKKIQILTEILTQMRSYFGEDVQYYNIYTCEKYGLVNIEIRKADMQKCSKTLPKGIMDFNKHSHTVNHQECSYQKKRQRHYYYYYPDHTCGKKYLPRIHWTQEAYGGNYHGKNYEEKLRNKETINVFQFILKKIHRNASDVFAFFDLDCCKIGWFPGLRKVKVSIGFIRSQCCKINYIDLDENKASNKHLHRITRYYRRSFIYTSIQPEPLLSYYHTHKNMNVKKKYKAAPKVNTFFRYLNPFQNQQQKKNKNKKEEKLQENQVVIYTWGYHFGNMNKDSGYYYMVPSNKVTLKKYIKLKEFKKIPFEDSSSDPYLAIGVGIKMNEDGFYEYEKRRSPNELAHGIYDQKLTKVILTYKSEDEIF